jgi:hypothetical protein
MTTPHESRPTRTSTCTGRLISAICAIYSEWRARRSRVRGNKKAHKSPPLLTLRPERRDGFGVSGGFRIKYHLMSWITRLPHMGKAALDEAARVLIGVLDRIAGEIPKCLGNRGLGANSGNNNEAV